MPSRGAHLQSVTKSVTTAPIAHKALINKAKIPYFERERDVFFKHSSLFYKIGRKPLQDKAFRAVRSLVTLLVTLPGQPYA